MTTMEAGPETVPYGLRDLHLVDHGYHPAEGCHIDPATQMIVEPDGHLLIDKISELKMETVVCTSKLDSRDNEWGSDDW